jgi:hypothetical protein
MQFRSNNDMLKRSKKISKEALDDQGVPSSASNGRGNAATAAAGGGGKSSTSSAASQSPSGKLHQQAPQQQQTTATLMAESDKKKLHKTKEGQLDKKAAMRQENEDDWTKTTRDVGEASPKDDRVPTRAGGVIAPDAPKAGMYQTFAEREIIISTNVVFFAPQPSSSSSAEGETVTSFQAQMAMSLTSSKNEIMKIFCDYCFGRGYMIEENGASSLKATKQKYGVLRIFQLRLGLNECQERVAIITFSIETLDSPTSGVDVSAEDSSSSSSTSSSSSSSSSTDDDDDDAKYIVGTEQAPQQSKRSRKASQSTVNSNSKQQQQQQQQQQSNSIDISNNSHHGSKHGSNKSSTNSNNKRKSKKKTQSEGSVTVHMKQQTLHDKIVEDHRNRLAQVVASTSTSSHERQLELLRVAQSYGGGSG